ncbi:AraC family transcriptional regulator [Streptococcus caprae]|uniref:AraC family transcriptional regulator n=1 Tax=Streptococcus caprae TaxID=1640501 RepID=A0ABV8CY66_9STRE
MAKVEFYLFNNQSYIDLFPIQFGREECEPLHSFGPATRKHYLFHYIISGKGTFYISGQDKAYNLSAGQGFLIWPDLICSYEADKNDPWAYMWVEFDGLKSEHFLKLAGLSKHQPIFNQTTSPTESPVYQEMNLLLKNHDKRSAFIISHLYLFLNAVIDLSMSQHPITHNDITELYIREAVNFIERHYQESITVDDMANHCNLNKHYFSRLFKKELNTSPQQFLIQYRLSKSCELLRNTTLSLHDIAIKVGYSNQFNYSTAFKRQYLQSPKIWRKENSHLIDSGDSTE